jgi:hypothetical protein
VSGVYHGVLALVMPAFKFKFYFHSAVASAVAKAMADEKAMADKCSKPPEAGKIQILVNS